MKLPRAPQRTTPGFAFSEVGRSLQECLANRKFGQKEMKEVIAFFGFKRPECVYCGSLEVKRWDHLIPISKGGETVLGNMVPACSRCDDSRRDIPYEEWTYGDAKHSPKSRGVRDINQRVKRIKVYVEQCGYVHRNLEERLSKEEINRLSEIRLKLREVRRDIEVLIDDYRTSRL